MRVLEVRNSFHSLGRVNKRNPIINTWTYKILVTKWKSFKLKFIITILYMVNTTKLHKKYSERETNYTNTFELRVV